MISWAVRNDSTNERRSFNVELKLEHVALFTLYQSLK